MKGPGRDEACGQMVRPQGLSVPGLHWSRAGRRTFCFLPVILQPSSQEKRRLLSPVLPAVLLSTKTFGSRGLHFFFFVLNKQTLDKAQASTDRFVLPWTPGLLKFLWPLLLQPYFYWVSLNWEQTYPLD